MVKKQLTNEEKAAIFALFKENVSQVQLAKRYGVSQSTISKIIKKANKFNMFGRLPGTGPKLAFNSHEMSYLIALTKKYPKSGSNKLSLMLKEKKNIDISPRTIRRYLFDSGLKGRIAVKKPFLSKANKNVRFEMAKEWLNMTNNDWEKIIWSDETKINLFGSDGKQYVRRLDGTRYENNHLSPTVKHGGGNVKVWDVSHLEASEKSI